MSNKSTRQVAALILLCLLGLLSLWAAFGGMSLFETNVFRTIYDMPDWLYRFAIITTQLGSVWMVMGVVGFLFVIKKNPAPALMVFKSSVIAYGVAFVLKWLVGRPRPMILLNDISSREMVVFGYGFPSAHAALATAMGLALLPYLPKSLRWVPFVWIALVAWTRLYLGVHAPLDIIGGIIIGILAVMAAPKIPWLKPKKNK